MAFDLEYPKDQYEAEFKKALSNPITVQSPELKKVREESFRAFLRKGFPSTRNENWKDTNLSSLAKIRFQIAKKPTKPIISSAKLDAIRPETRDKTRIVFENGFLSHEASRFDTSMELQIESMGSTEVRFGENWLEEKKKNLESHPFEALNTACFLDGAYIRVGKGIVVEEPVYLIFVNKPTGDSTIIHPRVFIHAQENSQATFVEEYLSLNEERYFTNSVTELYLEPGAGIKHYKVQEENPNAYHIGNIQARQEKNSRFESLSLSFGAHLARHDLSTELVGPGAECQFNGLYMIKGNRHVDHHTYIDHAVPHCTSHELYKGVLDDKARGVFYGKILVQKDAQKTDSSQSNHNLLLSKDAQVDTTPQLEIYADDVKCAHGTTVGQLDENSLFYLQSRGLDKKEAKLLLTYAFSNEIIQKIALKDLRNRINRSIFSEKLREFF